MTDEEYDEWMDSLTESERTRELSRSFKQERAQDGRLPQQGGRVPAPMPGGFYAFLGWSIAILATVLLWYLLVVIALKF